MTAASANGDSVTVPTTDRPAVVYFFSPGCYSCIAGTKAVADAQRQAPDSADFVAVNLAPGLSADDVQAFLKEADGAALNRTTDSKGELLEAFGIQALGTLVVLTPDGEVAYTSIDPPASAITEAVSKAAAS